MIKFRSIKTTEIYVNWVRKEEVGLDFEDYIYQQGFLGVIREGRPVPYE